MCVVFHELQIEPISNGNHSRAEIDDDNDNVNNPYTEKHVWDVSLRYRGDRQTREERRPTYDRTLSRPAV